MLCVNCFSTSFSCHKCSRLINFNRVVNFLQPCPQNDSKNGSTTISLTEGNRGFQGKFKGHGGSRERWHGHPYVSLWRNETDEMAEEVALCNSV